RTSPPATYRKLLPSNYSTDIPPSRPRLATRRSPLATRHSAESLPRDLDDQLRRPIQAEPARVEAEMVVRDVPPFPLEVALHVLLPVLVHLGDDALRVARRYPEAGDGAFDELFRRSTAEDMKPIAAVREEALRAASDEHRRSLLHRLFDHAPRDRDDTLLGKEDGRIGDRRQRFRRTEGERRRQSLDNRRNPLVTRRYFGAGESRAFRHGVDNGVVEECPAQRPRDPRRDLGSAGAVHARDGDERHGRKVEVRGLRFEVRDVHSNKPSNLKTST